jgi:hypothetical protein
VQLAMAAHNMFSNVNGQYCCTRCGTDHFQIFKFPHFQIEPRLFFCQFRTVQRAGGSVSWQMLMVSTAARAAVLTIF